MEHVRSLVESSGARVTGVESRQPPLYYALAALPWQWTAGQPGASRLLAMRVLSGLSGVATLALAWAAARAVWPARPLLAAATAALAALAPGFLFLLASVNNDPLAVALGSLVVLAALRLARPADRPAGRWWALWVAASLAGLAAKLTVLPVVLGSAAALLFGRRRRLLAAWWARAAGALALAVALAGYTVLLSRHPTTSMAASYAHFWPIAVWRAPLAYVRLGGLAESFRTLWYAYDYGVAWPSAVEVPLALLAAAFMLLAAAGLRWTWRAVPAVVWVVAATQVALVVIRYGFGDLLRIEMGGAGQAKAFFPAAVPLALLAVAGLDGLTRRAGPQGERWLAAGLIGWLCATDWISLAVTLWHHYRWWQVGA